MDIWLLGYLAIGAGVGFLAGMLGIGGGALQIPLLVWLFEAQGLPRDHVVHLAVGTGMATIVFTSLSSARAHAARGAVRWDIVKSMTPGILAGGLVGSLIASSIPRFVVAVLFVATVYAAGLNMLFERKPNPTRTLPGPAGVFAAGATISGVSAFAAVGGAFMSVPFMMWCNVPMIHAIGTAAAIGFPIAVAGTIGYVAGGWGAVGLPPWSAGYVYGPALVGVTIASMAVAPLGVMVAHRTPTRVLRKVFAVLFFVLATRMLVGLW
ncbi:MAG TPA: sulfite exporter TauE/SafE family protein [Burkholderiales bacterium]|nr:sulfite exporter TauE/SafE family protein [Burkholderiales bacterium]